MITLKKHKKFIVLLTAVLSISLCIVFTGCGVKNDTDSGQNADETMTVKGSYAINVYDINVLTGAADYVFVGKVIGETRVDDVSDSREMPYTTYKVKVVDNIKGNLRTDQAIPVQKAGGYSKKDDFYYLYEDDIMPQKDDNCIFYAYAQTDGPLVVSGANSTVVLNGAEAEDNSAKSRSGNSKSASFQKNSKYQKAVKAVDTQLDPGRGHTKSEYEKQ